VQGINEDVKRKLAEGEVSDPFTRRKTKPVLSTGGKVRILSECLLSKLKESSVPDPGSGTFLTPRSGIRDG
jgi:hypothetical protein